MLEEGYLEIIGIVEVQGTAEGHAFRRDELDALLAVGEAISCALAAMAIDEMGSRAVSLTVSL